MVPLVKECIDRMVGKVTTGAEKKESVDLIELVLPSLTLEVGLCVCVCVFVCVYMYVFTCVRVCVCAYLYTCMGRVYLCKILFHYCAYNYAHICMFACKYMHILVLILFISNVTQRD